MTYPFDGKNIVGEWKNGKEWNTQHQNKDGKIIKKKVNGKWEIQKFVLYRYRKKGVWGWYEDGDENRFLKYEGEIEKGKPHGQGTITSPDGLSYLGDWLNGKYHGQGTLSNSEGSKYVGEWKNGKKYGKGEELIGSGEYKGDRYKGDYINGFQDGVGTYFHKNGSKYKGQWKKDKFHGIGVYKWISGGRYEGEWENGLRHGKGKELLDNGDRYDGGYELGLRNGKGTYLYKNGRKVIGDWKDGKSHGQGIILYPNGIEYEGEVKNDFSDGFGVLKLKNGEKISGIWKKDKPWNVEHYGIDRNLIGRFVNGKYVDENKWKENESVTRQWTKQLGTSSDDRGHSVTTDSSGNIFVSGATEGGLDGNTSSGGNDMFLVKYNSSGIKQ